MSIYDQFLQFMISGICVGSIYAIGGLGFMIVYTVTRVINFANGEFIMLGGMLSATFYAAGLPLHLAILLATIITTLIGIIIYRTIIHPISEAPVFTLILVSFGAAIVIRGIALIIWGPEERSLPAFSGGTPIFISEAMINPQGLWIIGSTMLLAAGLFLFFKYTILGKAFRASAINSFAAGLMGIKTKKMGLFSFALASGLAAVGGAVLTPLMTTDISIGLNLALKGFIAALIGGLNRIEGVIVGGLILGVLEALGAGFIHSGFKEVIALGTLIVVLYFRRTGLLGGTEAGRV